mmetsp:Transcript_20319/g.51311  ORF Transcript_20319/g.51311 Transcript_20319/m.51311 type:complete len:241 (-) Transcript_20319:167-889(-)
MRDDRGSHTGNDTGGERHTSLRSLGKLRRLPNRVVDLLRGGSLDGELRHGVGHLLEEHWYESRVPAGDSLHGVQFFHGRNRSLGEARVGDLPNARGLERAQEDIGDRLSTGGSTEVDLVAVLKTFFVSQVFCGVDLEELESAELEPALDEVADRRGPQSRGQGSHALRRDHLPHAPDQTAVVGDGVQLDARFHHVHGTESSVGDGAAETAACRAIDEVLRVVCIPVVQRFPLAGRRHLVE